MMKKEKKKIYGTEREVVCWEYRIIIAQFIVTNLIFDRIYNEYTKMLVNINIFSKLIYRQSRDYETRTCLYKVNSISIILSS